MPALRLFNRRWLLASDDVPLPAAFFASFHLVWLALLVAWLGEINGPEDCRGVGPYYAAVGGLIASFAASCLCEIAAVFVGLRGSLFETQKRAAMPGILYANALCFVAQVGFNAYCTYLITIRPPRCSGEGGKPWDPVEVMQGAVWSTWAAIGGVLFLLFLAYNIFPDYTDPKEWQAQCQCLAAACCCRAPRHAGSNESYERLGYLFALMFGHIDLTPSDVLTAFLLALNRRRAQRRLAEAADEEREEGAEEESPKRHRHGRQRIPRRSIAIGKAPTMRSAAATTSAAATAATPDDSLPSPPSGQSSPGETSEDGLLQSMEAGTRRAAAAAAGSVGLPGRKAVRVVSLDAGELGPVDASTLDEVAYYMRYAFAAYGWMLFVWERKTAGVLQLCCGRSCGLWTSIAARRQGVPLLHGVQASYFNREAILQAAGIAVETNLVDVRLATPGVSVLPYFLAIDEDKHAVVLAIRGSLSLDDVVRDLLFEPAELEEWVAGAGRAWDDPLPPLQFAAAGARHAAHSGILEAARATLEDIRSSGALARLLMGPAARCAGYSLLVCGHSLGAGCAFLISLYLRQFFPDLRSMCYSPPGGLATSELSAGAAEWCTSVVCGKEMVPRLTLATFERVRNEIVRCAAHCRRPKAALLVGWALGRVWSDEALFYEEPLPEPQRWLDGYRKSLDETSTRRKNVEIAGVFGPPGRVMHLKAVGRKKVKAAGWRPWPRKGVTVRDYKAVWIDSQSLVDQGVQISGRMMADHFPDYSFAVLRRLASAGGEGAEVGVSDAAGEAEMRRRVRLGSEGAAAGEGERARREGAPV